jgi:hypothetical protein
MPIRKYILALLLFFPSFVSAQVGNGDISANVNISATIIRSIELITVNSITFGNTQPGQIEVFVNPVTDVNAGFMIAVGTPGAEFRLDYFQERQLNNTTSPGFINFRYEISTNDVEDQGSSIYLNYEDRNLRFNDVGKFYIWVGGRVNLENATPGNYEGDFTIEIDYI